MDRHSVYITYVPPLLCSSGTELGIYTFWNRVTVAPIRHDTPKEYLCSIRWKAQGDGLKEGGPADQLDCLNPDDKLDHSRVAQSVYA